MRIVRIETLFPCFHVNIRLSAFTHNQRVREVGGRKAYTHMLCGPWYVALLIVHTMKMLLMCRCCCCCCSHFCKLLLNQHVSVENQRKTPCIFYNWRRYSDGGGSSNSNSISDGVWLQSMMRFCYTHSTLVIHQFVVGIVFPILLFW